MLLGGRTKHCKQQHVTVSSPHQQPSAGRGPSWPRGIRGPRPRSIMPSLLNSLPRMLACSSASTHSPQLHHTLCKPTSHWRSPARLRGRGSAHLKPRAAHTGAAAAFDQLLQSAAHLFQPGLNVTEAEPLVSVGNDFLTFLATTVVVIPAFKFLKISPILGFLFSGVILAQLG